MTDWLLPFLIGAATGVLSAWGVGGGTLLLLCMTLLLGVEQTEAQGVNLLYFLPTAGVSLLYHRKNGYLDKDVLRRMHRTGDEGHEQARIAGCLAQDAAAAAVEVDVDDEDDPSPVPLFAEALTVTAQVNFFPATSAVMVALPSPTPLMLPEESTVAADWFDVDQETFAFVPVTVSLYVSPTLIVSAFRLILALLVTVTLQTYFFLPTFAVILAVPSFFPVTTPFLETAATAFLEDFHLIFCFLETPFTFNLKVFPTSRLTFFALIFGAASAAPV